MRFTWIKMPYALTFVEAGRTVRVPARFTNLFFDAIFTATGLTRPRAEKRLEAGPIVTATHVFKKIRWREKLTAA